MSFWDGFIYNFLAMGVIFPWVYAYAPGKFPGANLEIAIILTLLAQLPISFSYAFLSTILPVSGGDYIYQTRAFGKIGFVSVMSG
jgi:amino acid transporter